MIAVEFQTYAAPFGGPHRFCSPSDAVSLKITKKRQQELSRMQTTEMLASVRPLAEEALRKRGYGIGVIVYVFVMVQEVKGQPIKRYFLGCYRTLSHQSLGGATVTTRSRGDVEPIGKNEASRLLGEEAEDFDPAKRSIETVGQDIGRIFDALRAAEEEKKAKVKARTKARAEKDLNRA